VRKVGDAFAENLCPKHAQSSMGLIRLKRLRASGAAMHRREFIVALGGAAALPFAALAQEAGRVYRLGFLIPASRESIAPFFDELRINGFVEGQNLVVIGNFSATPEQSTAYVAALVNSGPDAIVSGPEFYARALGAATRTIPVVSMSEDLVGEGLATSLARPGGNITGISLLSPELDGKRQEFLIEAMPGVRRLAAVAHSTIVTKQHIEEQQVLARSRGVELLVFPFVNTRDIVSALNEANASGAEAVNFLASPHQVSSRDLILSHMAELRLPAIYQWPETPEMGGFMGYGPRFAQVYRQRARQIVKILRGAKVADIPIEQPTNFELVINLRTANALGRPIPAGLLARADIVIE
jgi:putative tryptophan/tyrosine transport system substrate-binding protein